MEKKAPNEEIMLLKLITGRKVFGICKEQVATIELPNIQKVKTKFEKTGTADVVTGKHYGVGIKDEGDFISVRFGSNELTEIGSVPAAERNFSTKDEAFAFAEQIQNHVRHILGRRGQEILPAQERQP